MDTLSGIEPIRPAKSNARWTICALLFFATTINYMDRQILGLLAPLLQHEIGWTEVQYAHVVTAFQAAYALGLLGFGRFIDKVGTKRGYLISVLFWSVAAAGHALVRSVFGFGVARFALGLGEAGNFPAAVKAVAEWFPKRERALANGIFNSGANIGAILAPLSVPWIVSHWGWRAAFVALGALGFFWLAAWGWFYDAPGKSRRVSPAELAHITSDPIETAMPPMRWGQLLQMRQMWAFLVGYAFTAPIWWFYLYWLPKFLNKRFDVDLLSLGLPLVVIYSVTSVGSVAGGWLSSRMIRLGWSVNVSRKIAMLVCAICVLPVMFAAQTNNLWVAIGLIAVAAAAHQGWAANLFALASDLFPKQAVASVVGLGGMAGSLAAMVFSESAGFILEKTGSYWSLFAISSCAYLTALVVIHALTPRLAPVDIR
ncbi:MAG TPA: MFS transporter [Tepidisphaeraceae bacterium]|jgi:ACS family hexuronate transporter-like MFS transporter|nr:MFS transporter [Tepidisphaeraceae bacterium]